jgi:threonine dehydrogenase-like Zn-dependent dehydrogenase
MHIDYSIISTGTERYGSKGYMAVSAIQNNGFRFILPVPHKTRYINEYKSNDYLLIDEKVSISSIAVARFQLISAIAFSRKKIQKYKNIAIVGAGALGIATYFELQRLGHASISILSRRYQNNLRENNIAITDYSASALRYYDCLVDCTGDGNLINEMIDNSESNTDVWLLGTPRDNILLNPLLIHRKNLSLVGGHELNGVSITTRQKLLDEITTWYQFQSHSFDCFVKTHMANEINLQDVYKHQFATPFHIISYL